MRLVERGGKMKVYTFTKSVYSFLAGIFTVLMCTGEKIIVTCGHITLVTDFTVQAHLGLQ